MTKEDMLKIWEHNIKNYDKLEEPKKYCTGVICYNDTCILVEQCENDFKEKPFMTYKQQIDMRNKRVLEYVNMRTNLERW